MRTRNFKTGRLRLTVLALISIVVVIQGCAKSQEAAPEKLAGPYGLVSDSIRSVTQVEFSYKHDGLETDYWNFDTHGKIYTKEGIQMDTLDYVLSAGDSINISGIPFTVQFGNDGTIKLQNIKPDIDFGGDYTRIVILKKLSIQE
jgi:hypothetical protein